MIPRRSRQLVRATLVRATLGLGLLVLSGIYGPALTQDAEPILSVAVLQGLDKVTARISTISAPLNEAVRFGSLRITARTCTKTPPTEPPEVTAFLEVLEVRPGMLPVPVFSGWMFASSPALSAMEHAVYDVWVIDCRAARIALPGAPAANP